MVRSAFKKSLTVLDIFFDWNQCILWHEIISFRERRETSCHITRVLSAHHAVFVWWGHKSASIQFLLKCLHVLSEFQLSLVPHCCSSSHCCSWFTLALQNTDGIPAFHLHLLPWLPRRAQFNGGAELCVSCWMGAGDVSVHNWNASVSLECRMERQLSQQDVCSCSGEHWNKAAKMQEQLALLHHLSDSSLSWGFGNYLEVA